VKIHEHRDVVVILVSVYGKKWQWPTEKKREKKKESLEEKKGKELEEKGWSRIVSLRSQ
jgi:nicotinamide riboside transporter PnuC